MRIWCGWKSQIVLEIFRISQESSQLCRKSKWFLENFIFRKRVSVNTVLPDFLLFSSSIISCSKESFGSRENPPCLHFTIYRNM